MKKGDKIAAIIIIVLIILSFAVVNIYKQQLKGDTNIAIIEHNGEIIETVNLNEIKEPKEWKIESEDGHYNIIRAEDGAICIIEANCPNLECVKTGWIDDPGEMTVCLPHKVLIRIEGKKDEVDGIAH